MIITITEIMAMKDIMIRMKGIIIMRKIRIIITIMVKKRKEITIKIKVTSDKGTKTTGDTDKK